MTTTAAVPMSVVDAINLRASTRAFAPTPISAAEIDVLLRAAVRAPTAMHGEPWVFVIIQDPARLQTLSDAMKQGVLAKALAIRMLEPNYNPFYGAGTLIAIGARNHGPFIEADCWLAAENLMLAATAAGLGTCCIGSAVGALNDPPIKAAIGLPANVHVVAPIVVGHPADVTPPTPRRSPEVAAWL
jgi:nitroreductase